MAMAFDRAVSKDPQCKTVHNTRITVGLTGNIIYARIKLMLSLLLCLPVNDDCSALRLDILFICCDVLRSEVTVCAELHIKSEP